jgi:hypothetical protein
VRCSGFESREAPLTQSSSEARSLEVKAPFRGSTVILHQRVGKDLAQLLYLYHRFRCATRVCARTSRCSSVLVIVYPTPVVGCKNSIDSHRCALTWCATMTSECFMLFCPWRPSQLPSNRPPSVCAPIHLPPRPHILPSLFSLSSSSPPILCYSYSFASSITPSSLRDSIFQNAGQSAKGGEPWFRADCPRSSVLLPSSALLSMYLENLFLLHSFPKDTTARPRGVLQRSPHCCRRCWRRKDDGGCYFEPRLFHPSVQIPSSFFALQ